MYLLTENKNVILGPMSWKPRSFQSELDDLEVDFIVPIVAPEYIQIDNIYEIIPVSDLDYPDINYNFEQLVGPFYNFENNRATGYYTKTNLDINVVKNNLKTIIAFNRYNKEILGCTVIIQNVTVTVDTSRDGRNIFVQKYMLMDTAELVEWKFPECWLTLSKTDLGLVIFAGATWIQNQFTWENSISTAINAASTIEELKLITLVPGD